MEITLEILKNRYKNLHKLFNYGSKGLYDDYHGIVAYEEIGITKEYAKELLKMALDKDFDKLVYYENEDEYLDDMEDEDPALLATYTPCHALMALASLEIETGSQQLMDDFDNVDSFDDNYLFAFDYFFASNYIPNIELIHNVLFDKKASDEKRIRIFYIFEEITKYFKDDKNLKSIEDISIEFLQTNDKNSEMNALAINILVLVNGVKHIEFIRECFKTKKIDELYSDSLEEIEIKLGVREKAI